jgi:hypothetical protein
MWALLLNPVFRKYAIYCTIVLALLYVGLRYRSSLIEQGIERGRIQATQDIEKAKQQEWVQQENKIQSQQAAINAAKVDIDAQQKRLDRQRELLYNNVENSLGVIAGIQKNESQSVNNLSGSDLDDALRAQSTKLGPPVIPGNPVSTIK